MTQLPALFYVSKSGRKSIFHIQIATIPYLLQGDRAALYDSRNVKIQICKSDFVQVHLKLCCCEFPVEPDSLASFDEAELIVKA